MGLLAGVATYAAWKLDPIGVGHRGLRGFLMQRGVDVLGLPLPASRALAEETLTEVRAQSRFLGRSSLAELAAYTEALEVVADQVYALLFKHDRSAPHIREEVRRCLERHGVSLPQLPSSPRGT